MQIDRLPPQDILTEQSVLASCLLDPGSLQTALEILDPEDFYSSNHKNIFSTFKYLTRHKKPVDLTTVGSCLLEFKKLEEIGGAVFLSKLIDECPVAVNIEAYTEIVKSKSVLRQLIKVQSKNIDKCYSATSEAIPELLDDTQKSILSIEMTGNKGSFINMADMTMQSVERYEKLQEGRGDRAVRTGFPTIDSLTGGGFRGSKLIILSGRPKMGKTSFMLNMASNMAKRGEMVGIFSIEMDKEELDDRFISSETGINSLKFGSCKHLSADDWERIIEAAEEKSKWPIIIDDTGSLNILEIKRRARIMKKAGVKIIFIDQLSRIKSTLNTGLYEQNTDILNELSCLKKDLRMPIVLLAQIGRKLEERTDKKPRVSDLKSTGSLEEDPDIILLLYRKYVYSKKEEDKESGYIELALQRHGPAGVDVPLNWTPKTTTFTEKHET